MLKITILAVALFWQQRCWLGAAHLKCSDKPKRRLAPRNPMPAIDFLHRPYFPVSPPMARTWLLTQAKISL